MVIKGRASAYPSCIKTCNRVCNGRCTMHKWLLDTLCGSEVMSFAIVTKHTLYAIAPPSDKMRI